MTRFMSRLAFLTPRMSWRLVLVATLALAPVIVPATAQAHGEGETQEGYLLVQQALAHLAHDSSMDGVDLAMEKVKDSLETEDQEGLNVAEVKQGMKALEAGQVDRARMLLQDSIAAALANQPLATGYETGTGLVPSELPGRGSLGVGDWLLLGLSIAVGGVGLWLSVRFRPHDNVSALQLLLGPGTSGASKRRRRIRMVRHPR